MVECWKRVFGLSIIYLDFLDFNRMINLMFASFDIGTLWISRVDLTVIG